MKPDPDSWLVQASVVVETTNNAWWIRETYVDQVLECLQKQQRFCKPQLVCLLKICSQLDLGLITVFASQIKCQGKHAQPIHRLSDQCFTIDICTMLHHLLHSSYSSRDGFTTISNQEEWHKALAGYTNFQYRRLAPQDVYVYLNQQLTLVLFSLLGQKETLWNEAMQLVQLDIRQGCMHVQVFKGLLQTALGPTTFRVLCRRHFWKLACRPVWTCMHKELKLLTSSQMINQYIHRFWPTLGSLPL